MSKQQAKSASSRTRKKAGAVARQRRHGAESVALVGFWTHHLAHLLAHRFQPAVNRQRPAGHSQLA